MIDRLIDYGLVAMVILVVLVVFRLSRTIMNRLLDRLKRNRTELTSDHLLVTGFVTLLTGLIFLPFITSVLALIDNHHLTGGMILHLFLVTLSVILFSIAEDLFRLFTTYPAGDRWSVGRHFQIVLVPIAVFWLIGCMLVSPLFYSGLTIILTLFYFFALSCRPRTDGAE